MVLLRFSLSSVPEEGLPLEISLSEDQIRPEGVSSIDVHGVIVKGLLEETDGKYFFRGTVAGTFQRVCDRCLTPIEHSFVNQVFWIFEEGTPGSPWEKYDRDDELETDYPDQNSSVGYYSGDELDMTPLVWEEVVLAMPIKVLCKENCAGLCPHCGKNLNEGTCGCSESETAAGSSVFAKLRDMFPISGSNSSSKED